MTNSLEVRSFNLALVNAPLENLLASDSFSKIFLTTFQLFPTIQQVGNPLIFLVRPSGGELQINPMGLFFKDIQTLRFDDDLKSFFQIINLYHTECKISELKELNLRLVFYSKASIVNGMRKLLTHDIVIPKELFQSLPDFKIHMGLRFVFTVGITRYDLKIEPRFSNLEENYIDFNVIIPKSIKTEEVLDMINEQRTFFNDRILPFIAR